MTIRAVTSWSPGSPAGAAFRRGSSPGRHCFCYSNLSDPRFHTEGALPEKEDQNMTVVPIPSSESQAEHDRIRKSNDRDQEMERKGKVSRHNRGYDETADGSCALRRSSASSTNNLRSRATRGHQPEERPEVREVAQASTLRRPDLYRSASASAFPRAPALRDLDRAVARRLEAEALAFQVQPLARQAEHGRGLLHASAALLRARTAPSRARGAATAAAIG